MHPLCEISMFCWIKSTQFHLRNIVKIRKYLDEGSTETLVPAFVSSKLDYSNSLLYVLPKCLKVNLVAKIMQSAYLGYFLFKAQKITISRSFNQILLVTSQAFSSATSP